MFWPLEPVMATFADYTTDAEDANWRNTFALLPVDDTQDSPQSSQPNVSESSHSAINIPGAYTAPSLPAAASQEPVRFELEDDTDLMTVHAGEFLIVRLAKMSACLIQFLTLRCI